MRGMSSIFVVLVGLAGFFGDPSCYATTFPETYQGKMRVEVVIEGSPLCDTELSLEIVLHENGDVEAAMPYWDPRGVNGPPCTVSDEIFRNTTAGTHDGESAFTFLVYEVHQVTGTFTEEGIRGSGSASFFNEFTEEREEWTVTFSMGGDCPDPGELTQAVYCDEDEFLEASRAGAFSGMQNDDSPSLTSSRSYDFDPPVSALGFAVENPGESEESLYLSLWDKDRLDFVDAFEPLTVPAGASVFIGVTLQKPVDGALLQFSSSGLQGPVVRKRYSLSVIDMARSSDLSYDYLDGQVFRVYGKAAPGRMNWVLAELQGLFPGVWLARPSDAYCAEHGRYLYVFALDPAILNLPDEADLWVNGPPAQGNVKHSLLGFQGDQGGPEALYYADNLQGDRLEIGYLSLFRELGKVVLRTARGDLTSLPSLDTVQEIALTPAW